MAFRTWPEMISNLAEAATEDWVALEQDDRTLSIRALAQAIESAAGALSDDPAPLIVSTRDGILHTTATLAAGRAGRPALMIDSRTPDDLVREIARRAGASAILGRDIGDIPTIDPESLKGRAPPPPRIRPADAVNTMILTSGSTGVPKIVKRSVEADMVATLNLRNLDFPMEAGGRFLLLAPSSSGAFLTCVMGALSYGATVVFGEFQADMGSLLAQKRITNLYFVTTMLRLASAVDGLEGPGWDGLRGFTVGGEKLDAATLERLKTKFPTKAVVLYGMSEAPVITSRRFTDPAPVDAVGQLLPGRDVRFLEPATSTEVPPGEEGQLSVRSPDLFLGYVGQEPVEGWYTTGDMGRLDADGYLYITGRANDQVKVGGNRVSTDEVVALIEGHPLVSKAAVVALDDPVWTSKLVAFVVREPGAGLSAEDLAAWLRTKTTAYRVPRQIRFLDGLPMDPSGKLARRTLLALANEEQTRVVTTDLRKTGSVDPQFPKDARRWEQALIAETTPKGDGMGVNA